MCALATTAKPFRTIPPRALAARAAPGAGAPAAPSQPVVTDTSALQQEMVLTLAVCRALAPEAVHTAPCSLGRHLSPLPSAVSVPFVIKAKIRSQLATILSSNRLLFGADAAQAATQLKQWRKYIAAKPPSAPAAPPQQQLLAELQAVLKGLADSTDWPAAVGAIAPFLSGSVATGQQLLDGSSWAAEWCAKGF